MTPWLVAGIALLSMGALFAAAYVWARRIDNYSIVDVVWSYAFAGLAIAYAAAADGWERRRWLLVAVGGAWSVRLGTHLLIRVARHHPAEDRRYQQLRRDWSANFASRMFGFFQLQAVSVVALGVPFLLIAGNAQPRWHALEILGASVWLLAVAGEAIADAQLAAFRRQDANQGKVCDVGFWRYSRHPNYFFEWLVWIGYALAALAAPWGWLGLMAPLAMLFLLLRVTGIPLTEQQSLLSKGDAYRQYQQVTNAFFPGPRKRRRAAESSPGGTVPRAPRPTR